MNLQRNFQRNFLGTAPSVPINTTQSVIRSNLRNNAPVFTPAFKKTESFPTKKSYSYVANKVIPSVHLTKPKAHFPSTRGAFARSSILDNLDNLDNLDKDQVNQVVDENPTPYAHSAKEYVDQVVDENPTPYAHSAKEYVDQVVEVVEEEEEEEEEEDMFGTFGTFGTLDLDDIVALDDSESIHQLNDTNNFNFNLPINLDYTKISYHNEIKWSQLLSLMLKKPLISRKITDFCGHYIYGENNNIPGICSRPNCPYIHSNDITKFQHYLKNKKVKSFQCMKSNNCNFYVCLFRHPADQYLLYKSSVGVNQLYPLVNCNKNARKLAAQNHKILYNK